MTKNKEQLIKNALRVSFLILLDIICINLSVFISLMVRFDLNFEYILKYENDYLNYFLWFIPINTFTTILIFTIFRLYSNLLKFVSLKEICYIIAACIISNVTYFTISAFAGWNLPRSCYIIATLFLISFILIIRFSRRLFEVLKKEIFEKEKKNNIRRVMIIGAGDTGGMLIRETKQNGNMKKRKVVCVIDSDETKKGRYIYGVKIVGGRDSIVDAITDYKVDEIIYAVPSSTDKEKTEILNICKKTDCMMKILPGMNQILSEDDQVDTIRKVQMEDLLGKSKVMTINANDKAFIEGKSILVTGGGGSVGSGICRYVAQYKPKKIVIVDMYENNIFEIQRSLREKYQELKIEVFVSSIRDEKIIQDVFEKTKPNIVFHCAGHKHVPLMENNPSEAVKNNIFGTLNVMRAADRNNVEKFILISTDKAVQPTNVMAQTKRICEMLVQTLQKESKTIFAAVRFGNVLGSNGGVVEIFKNQIEQGRPLRVTDERMTRNFITVGEVSALIVQAAAMANGGEIYSLGASEPIKILDLAENMIRLSGYIPYVDIDIRFTGLRAGEELTEENLIKTEDLIETTNKDVFICQTADVDAFVFASKIDELGLATINGSHDNDIKLILNRILE